MRQKLINVVKDFPRSSFRSGKKWWNFWPVENFGVLSVSPTGRCSPHPFDTGNPSDQRQAKTFQNNLGYVCVWLVENNTQFKRILIRKDKVGRLNGKVEHIRERSEFNIFDTETPKFNTFDTEEHKIIPFYKQEWKGDLRRHLMKVFIHNGDSKDWRQRKRDKTSYKYLTYKRAGICSMFIQD